jgi:Protein of unknown function (DUF3500)
VSLTFTVTEGRYLSATPCMLGSVPAAYGTLAPLADDEARGCAFVNSLSGAQRAAAIIYHRRRRREPRAFGVAEPGE